MPLPILYGQCYGDLNAVRESMPENRQNRVAQRPRTSKQVRYARFERWTRMGPDIFPLPHPWRMNGLHQAWPHRIARLAHLPRLHELWRTRYRTAEARPTRLDAQLSREPALFSP